MTHDTNPACFDVICTHNTNPAGFDVIIKKMIFANSYCQVMSPGLRVVCFERVSSPNRVNHPRLVRCLTLASTERFHHICISSPLIMLFSVCMRRYLRTFQSGFDTGLCNVQLLFMQSDGGLADIHTFSGGWQVQFLKGPGC